MQLIAACAPPRATSSPSACWCRAGRRQAAGQRLLWPLPVCTTPGRLSHPAPLWVPARACLLSMSSRICRQHTSSLACATLRPLLQAACRVCTQPGSRAMTCALSCHSRVFPSSPMPLCCGHRPFVLTPAYTDHDVLEPGGGGRPAARAAPGRGARVLRVSSRSMVTTPRACKGGKTWSNMAKSTLIAAGFEPAPFRTGIASKHLTPAP